MRCCSNVATMISATGRRSPCGTYRGLVVVSAAARNSWYHLTTREMTTVTMTSSSSQLTTVGPVTPTPSSVVVATKIPPPPPPTIDGRRRFFFNSSSSTTFASTSSASVVGEKKNKTEKPVALFLNSRRLDYDHQLDWTRLESLVELHKNDVDKLTSVKDMVDLVQQVRPEIIITKEMIVPPDAVSQWMDSSSSSSSLYEGPKLFCEAGTGYNNIPLKVCRQHDIIVCNVPTYSTEAVAHTAITYIMNFSLSMMEQQRFIDKHNDRSNFTDHVQLPLHELTGQTVGLVGGAGRIGTAVAHVCLALGMNVIISSRRPTLPDGHSLLSLSSPSSNKVTIVQDIERDLLPHCDYVSLHAPLNDETRESFGRAQIECMKPTSYLVNTSRGGVIREHELIECMEEKRIAGAGLDVQSSEPPSMESKLWTLDNVFLSPHIGWRRIETRQRLVDMTCDNIRSYIDATTKETNSNSNNNSDNKSVVADKCINVVS